MAHDYPAVRIVELEDRIAPDNSFEEAYAIYFRLSYEPPLKWQDTFESLMKREVHPRIVSFVGPSLRVVVTRKDHLATVANQVSHLARETNIQLNFLED